MQNLYSATVVSIVPFPIDELKPGVYPGVFKIPASKDMEPQVLIVGESIFHVEVDEGRFMTVKSPPNEMAQAIVRDYITSNLAYNDGENAAPGLMWFDGTYTPLEIKTKFKKELDELKQSQWNWFIKLVKMADDDWEKTRQHKTISDMQRHAARAIGQERPWLINAPNDWMIQASTAKNEMMNCQACQSYVSKMAILCPNCKMIFDMKKYKELSFAGSESAGVK